jgi:hypothetical protein
MAGQPITRSAVAALEAYTLDRVLDLVIDGLTLEQVVAQVRRDKGAVDAARAELGNERITVIKLSRPILARWLNGALESIVGEQGKARAVERRRLYHEARALSAQSIVEDGMAQLDRTTDNKAAHLAKAKADFKLRLAESYDRKVFGSQVKQAVEVNVNLGAQHLDALRRRTVTARVEVAQVEDDEPDFEVAPNPHELKQLPAPNPQLTRESQLGLFD